MIRSRYQPGLLPQILALVAVSLLLVACTPPTPQVVYKIVTVYATPARGGSSTPASTLTPFPSPTPTPTPTAQPLLVSGNPRAVRLLDPVPQVGAPCGLVDILDFPLDPPDGEQLRIRYGFGSYRSSYGKYHAGDDLSSTNRASLGAPVYSIGHGAVTYAEPEGWGADKGVVIIRHVFPDGAEILSFYGHLDPDSVTLGAGNCVQRGDLVGRIGEPRSPPHLHFEVRHHMPVWPGGGYWSSDPLEAGWESPIRFIWENRLGNAPGALWGRPFVEWFTRPVGMINGDALEDTFVAIEDLHVIGIDPLGGGLLWQQPISNIHTAVGIDAGRGMLYIANWDGQLSAYRPPGRTGGLGQGAPAAVETIWRIDLGLGGTPTLMPLPDGGAAVYALGELIGVSKAGGLLWQLDGMPTIFDWALGEGRLVFTTTGENPAVWKSDGDSPVVWMPGITGRPLILNGRVLLYAEDGLYRLDEVTGQPELLRAFGKTWLEDGCILALPDGGLLLAHTGLHDRRLIALEANGALRWERSYAELSREPPRLLVQAGRVYVLLHNGSTSPHRVQLFSLDAHSGEMALIFEGGTHNTASNDTWLYPLDGDRLLLNIGGGGMLALDAGLAFQVVAPTFH